MLAPKHTTTVPSGFGAMESMAIETNLADFSVQPETSWDFLFPKELAPETVPIGQPSFQLPSNVPDMGREPSGISLEVDTGMQSLSWMNLWNFGEEKKL